MAHPTLGGLRRAAPAVLGLTFGCHVPDVPKTSPRSPPPPRAPQPLLKDTWRHVCASREENEGDRDGAVSAAAAAAPGHDGLGGGERGQRV